MRRPDRRTRYTVAHDLGSWRLDQHLPPELDVLDAGCGHGELADDTTPPWQAVAAEAEAVYDAHQVGGALIFRHVRLVWTVRLP
jgi:hypothetical protein